MKPFTLEEYKKDPSRLCWRDGASVKSELVFNDTHLAILSLSGSGYLQHVDQANKYFALSTKYEVRRARPYREGVNGFVYIARDIEYSQIGPGTGAEWAGPEFEYKVEV